MPPELCPECGALVPRDARACPGCGADEETGWSDRAAAQRLGLPEDEFDYDEFVKSEFSAPAKSSPKPHGLHWIWWLVGILLLLAFLAGMIRW